jgi:DNA-directed RNA polymerase subunit M/transcription elongation factor TFIIS
MNIGKKEHERALNISIKGNPKTKFYCSKCKMPIAIGYNRVVIGGRGPYIEFLKEGQIIDDNCHITNNLHKFFEEYCSNCVDKLFIYYQLKTVSYADYKVDMFYISPSLLCLEDGTPCIDYNKGTLKSLF